MNEVDEICIGKNKEELEKELRFQMQNGEHIGGPICSIIIEYIDRLERNEQTKERK